MHRIGKRFAYKNSDFLDISEPEWEIPTITSMDYLVREPHTLKHYFEDERAGRKILDLNQVAARIYSPRRAALFSTPSMLQAFLATSNSLSASSHKQKRFENTPLETRVETTLDDLPEEIQHLIDYLEDELELTQILESINQNPVSAHNFRRDAPVATPSMLRALQSASESLRVARTHDLSESDLLNSCHIRTRTFVRRNICTPFSNFAFFTF
ncbi:hypothetical protein Ddc_20294 [Ditylenchus destructor]|nr:hypothetical protein Ddc_20294 [Ditylenchus destructor]